MRIALMSDLHLEYEIGAKRNKAPRNHPFRLESGQNVLLGPILSSLREAAPDVIVLAGDIDVGMRAVLYASMLRNYVGAEIVLVPGNHEFYGSTIWQTRELYRLHNNQKDGVHILDNNTVDLGGVTFIGSTLWADFSLFGQLQAHEISTYLRRSLKDFELIIGDKELPITPADIRSLHHDAVTHLHSALSASLQHKTIVVTHHAPHILSIPERNRTRRVAAAYATDLESLISRHKPDLWLHGHVHWRSDYYIGATRVLCNPRGYFPNSLVPYFDPCAAIVELPT